MFYLVLTLQAGIFVGVIKVMMAAEACGFAEIDFRFALSITETPLEGSFTFFSFFSFTCYCIR